jgi:uncharacterized protein (TIGR02677 family)
MRGRVISLALWQSYEPLSPLVETHLSSSNGQDQSQQEQNSAGEPTAAFQRFGPIQLFNYLTPISERTDWYRAIMRTFFLHSRSYRYQLTVQEVVEAVREEIMQEYHLEACKADLERLVKWGNLTTLYDTGRVTTIADFRSPILRYQAIPEALALEAFLASHVQRGGSEGELSQGDLSLLWQSLEQVDTLLQEDQMTSPPEHRQEIADQWRRAFTTWEKVTNDAAQYLSSMNQSALQTTNLASYLAYKQIVVHYIHNFAQQLVHYSNSIRALLSNWSLTGKLTLLLQTITSVPPPTQALAESLDEWHEDVKRQIEALEHWFLDTSNVDLFVQAAGNAVQKVVHRAYALASSMRPQTDYVGMLSSLAGQLMQVEDMEMAQLLFATAFASATPIHLPEAFTGEPAVASVLDERSTWQSPPTVVRSLRPIYKGNVERSVEPSMKHSEQDLYQLKQQHDAEVAAQQQRFDRLLHDQVLDVGTICEITPEERGALTEVIDGCLCNPALEYRLPDGSLVTLLNLHESCYVHLCSCDGTLLLPRYRLHRQRTDSKKSEEAS